MKTALIASVGALALLTSACGSEAEAPKQKDFDHGTVVGTGGAAGATSKEAPYPSFLYPEAPYGTKIDSVIEPLALLGWKAPADAAYDPAAFEPVSIAEYYNPDGTKPWKMLWINSSAVWCGPCNEEYAFMRDNDTYEQKLKPLGVQVFGTLMEDGANPPNPAKPTNLKSWGTKYEVKFPMGLDPAFRVGVYFAQGTVPGGLLVDTKNMKIVEVLTGGSIPDLCCNSQNCYQATEDDCVTNACGAGLQCVEGVVSKIKGALAKL